MGTTLIVTIPADKVPSKEIRMAGFIEAMEIGGFKRNHPIHSVIVVKGYGEEGDNKLIDLQKEINKGLAKNGFGSLKDKREITLINGDNSEALENLEAEIVKLERNLAKESRKHGITVFAPEELSKELRDNGYDQTVIGIINDKLSDYDEQSLMPNCIMARYAIARNIFSAFNITDPDKSDNISVINSFLGDEKIEGNSLESINRLFAVNFFLDIKPVDWNDITEWQDSQRAMATSL